MNAMQLKGQQEACGFDTVGVERLRLAALGKDLTKPYNLLADTHSLLATIKRKAALINSAKAVTLLNDNGTVSVVSMQEAIRRDKDILEACAREKAYRPCHSCGRVNSFV